ncbi:ABC transporter permease subunit [Oricola thermophila]|uniref:ABC transporter permease subunit n=1 Tax=Oricola thermophila TaxID=2742145 RepID=A0A6N1VKT8_9HYPH|nr:ABC transporter permease subunit [Oricola thermophila]QKV20022.1 ABC transporter permease subunit [Oricola thermophila]
MTFASLVTRLGSRRIQAGLAVATVCLLSFLVYSVQQELMRQGIVSGFDFLWRSTGWDISFSLIPYSISDPYWKVLLIGLTNTLFLGFSGLALATLVGVLAGVARTAANPVLNALGTIYVETFRNVPLILQAFFWYAVFTHMPPPRKAIAFADMVFFSSRGLYVPGLNVSDGALALCVLVLVAGIVISLWLRVTRCLKGRGDEYRKLIAFFILLTMGVAVVAIAASGRLEGVPLVTIPELRGLNIKGGFRMTSEFAALLTAMSLYGGAYLGEIIRAGFLAVEPGQIEAAKALGLRPWRIFTLVRLPLAIRAILPTLTNQYVWLIKATTLGVAVGFSDFFLVISTSINQSGQTVELLLLLMGGFLLINYTLGSVMNAINRSIAIKGPSSRK